MGSSRADEATAVHDDAVCRSRANEAAAVQVTTTAFAAHARTRAGAVQGTTKPFAGHAATRARPFRRRRRHLPLMRRRGHGRSGDDDAIGRSRADEAAAIQATTAPRASEATAVHAMTTLCRSRAHEATAVQATTTLCRSRAHEATADQATTTSFVAHAPTRARPLRRRRRPLPLTRQRGNGRSGDDDAICRSCADEATAFSRAAAMTGAR